MKMVTSFLKVEKSYCRSHIRIVFLKEGKLKKMLNVMKCSGMKYLLQMK